MKLNGKKVFIGSLLLIVIFAVIAVGIYMLHRRSLPTSEAISEAIRHEFGIVIGYDEQPHSPFLAALDAGLQITVNSVSKTEDSTAYIATCTLSNYDIQETFARLSTQEGEMSIADYYQLFSEQFDLSQRMSSDYPFIVSETEDGVYSVAFTEEALNAATGGLLSHFEVLEEESE